MLVMANNGNCWIIPVPCLLFILLSYLNVCMHYMVAIITNLLVWIKWWFGHDYINYLFHKIKFNQLPYLTL